MNTLPSFFRQLCDKPSSKEIKCMQWSPKSDLIAIITAEGEVRLHRLYWAKVWSYSEKGCTFSALTWKPDGKVLAVGDESGSVRLLEVENCSVMHQNDLAAPITSMEWFESQDGNMSVLVVGTKSGHIELFVNGTFKLISIFTSQCICDVNMSRDLGILTSVSSSERSDSQQANKFSLYKLDLLSSRSNEIKVLSKKYEEMYSLLQKLDAELKEVSELWENNLQKVSSKFDKLAEILPDDTSILNEFLILFSCGVLRPELQSFLVNELTMKGLRKLGTDINASYADIETHVNDNVESLCNQLSMMLSELLGMARWYEKFGLLGLCESKLQECTRYFGSFMLKIKELLSVMDEDIVRLGAFFKWLSGVMYRISDETVPAMFKEFSEEENSRILEFLQTHLVKSKDEQSFHLERFRRRIEKPTPWYRFVESTPSLRENFVVIPSEKDASLVEMADKLRKGIDKIFENVTTTATESFCCQDGSIITSFGEHKEICSRRFSWKNGQKDTFLCALPCTCNSDTFYIIEMDTGNPVNLPVLTLSIDVNKIPNQSRTDCQSTVILDAHFYSENSIALILEGTGSSEPVRILALLQLPHVSAADYHRCSLENLQHLSATDVSTYITKWRHTESFDPVIMTASCTRKVSCLLSKNRRRVQIYDMDAEEEEEADESDEESNIDEN
ncbi:anaphase-promoting complex subunit 4-like [Rhopilema esculentum]|uniref:anaphase-promoting complex subunit 4-like n=1 Tax=Rhopilema esculentum TaxID=499914 RepID=UPI0031E0034A